jgi:hypothetical protein
MRAAGTTGKRIFILALAVIIHIGDVEFFPIVLWSLKMTQLERNYNISNISVTCRFRLLDYAAMGNDE